MHEITLLVTVQVDSDDTLSEAQSREAAIEAVTNALEFVENAGFEHSFADTASVGVVAVEAVK